MAADYKRFGRWLKETRENKGLTQEELGKAISSEKAYVSKLELATPHSTTGKPPMATLETLHALSKVLGVQITEPLKAYGYIKDTGILLDTRETETVQQLRRLPTAQRELILDLINLAAARHPAHRQTGRNPRTGTDNL